MLHLPSCYCWDQASISVQRNGMGCAWALLRRPNDPQDPDMLIYFRKLSRLESTGYQDLFLSFSFCSFPALVSPSPRLTLLSERCFALEP